MFYSVQSFLFPLKQTFGTTACPLFFVWLMKSWKTEPHSGSKHRCIISTWCCALELIQKAPLKAEKKPTPFLVLFAKIESRPHCSSGYGNVSLFVCLITVSGQSPTRLQLCLCVLLVFHMCSAGTWGLREGFHWSSKFFCSSLRSCGAPALSLTLNRLLAYCGSPLCYLQSPSLQSGFKKWCDREAGCRQIWQSCLVFLKDKSTEDYHNVPCPSSKRLTVAT